MRACTCVHDPELDNGGLTPLDVLSKLDRVVRRTTSRRQFVALFYALLDAQARTFRFACAGHPPVLHLRPEAGTLDELGFAALPLGARLAHTLEEREVAMAPGDVFRLHHRRHRRDDELARRRLRQRSAAPPAAPDAERARRQGDSRHPARRRLELQGRRRADRRHHAGGGQSPPPDAELLGCAARSPSPSSRSPPSPSRVWVHGWY
ncbi:MAG: SpoIIE family protein phosphatase [Thermoanaerobaculia bacterium]|nr:SpoIIE family protein phosphatase [Thermoanaerobaculia bacterium]